MSPNSTSESEDNTAHAVNQVIVYVTVPLSLLLLVGLLVPCLYFMIQLKQKKKQLQEKVYYISEDSGTRNPVAIVNNDPSSHLPTLSHHYSYIGRDEVLNYGYSQPCENYISSLQYTSANELTDEKIFNIPESSEDALYDQLTDISVNHVDRERINIMSELGSGQFGKVYKGVWSSPNGDMEVAIKTLKEDSKEEDRVKFLQEAAIMGQFTNSSIVTMHGIVAEGQPILIVLELLSKGDLRNYLISSKSKSDNDVMNEHTLLSYCRQVVCGMHYLANKNFIHRDLAARNILVSGDDTCKIADFGMSRELLYQETYESHGGMIPVKWTAPEALFYKTYSTASDVWSYGILLFEIWSVGHKPFEDLKNKAILTLLETGKRLAPPPGCPRAIYSIMINCWNSDPSMRPTFESLSQTLAASDLKLLKWSEKDRLVHPEATVLGADLSSAENLYIDLQQTYHKPSGPA